MNIKRIFGAILTVLGIIGLIYTAVLFTNNGNGKTDYKEMITYAILSTIFFIAGISLVQTIKDEA
jgi:NADH:ubiquinone oxidoreductase subunit 4 (subunit M)